MKNPNDQCWICNKSIYRRPSDRSRYPKGYCKQHKKTAYQQAALESAETRYQKYIDRWKQGLESGMRGKTSISSHLRKYLFRKHNSSCQKCNWSQINAATQLVPLEVNHIDGNFKNNQEKNLELLCPNCHALTPNYRSLNNGNGRTGR